MSTIKLDIGHHKPIIDHAGNIVPIGGQLVHFRNAIERVMTEEAKLSKDIKDTGVMVALPVPTSVGTKLLAATQERLPTGAQLEPLENLHLTLAFIGDLAQKQQSITKDALGAIVGAFARSHTPLQGKVGGVAKFMAGSDQGKVPLVALYDCPELPALRQELIKMLKANEVDIDETHGFTPHITLAYCPLDSGTLSLELEPLELTFDHIAFVWAGAWQLMELSAAMGKRQLSQFESADLFKHCGVCKDDDAYAYQPISREMSIAAPIQGANETEIVAVSPHGLPARAFAWKAEGNENPGLVEQIGHPQYLAEEACYLLDRALQFYLVPVSFVATVDGERGAAIHWVLDSGGILHAFQYAPEWIERAALFDYISGQTDRGHDPHVQNVNYLTHPDDPKRMILIDNGLSFPTRDSTRNLASDFVDVQGNQPFGPQIMDTLPMLKDNSELWRRISDLVGAEATEEAQKRLQSVLDHGVLTEHSQ